LGDVPTEAGLARYCALAPVCTQWHAAISAVTRRRCALRHASMFVDGPRPLNGFKRPTFLEITPTDELLVADNHRVSLLPLPRPLTDEEDAEAAAAAASAGGSGGSGRGGGFQFGRLAPPTNGLGRVLRTFGNGDGSGGSGPGELCACHPPSACPPPPSPLPSPPHLLGLRLRTQHRPPNSFLVTAARPSRARSSTRPCQTTPTGSPSPPTASSYTWPTAPTIGCSASG